MQLLLLLLLLLFALLRAASRFAVASCAFVCLRGNVCTCAPLPPVTSFTLDVADNFGTDHLPGLSSSVGAGTSIAAVQRDSQQE
jgi:hypothetical protein